jgi:hypothetical protein
VYVRTPKVFTDLRGLSAFVRVIPKHQQILDRMKIIRMRIQHYLDVMDSDTKLYFGNSGELSIRAKQMDSVIEEIEKIIKQ